MDEIILHYDLGQQVALRTGELGFVTELGIIPGGDGSVIGTSAPQYYVKTKLHPRGFWVNECDILTEKWEKFKFYKKNCGLDKSDGKRTLVGITVSEKYPDCILFYFYPVDIKIIPTNEIKDKILERI